MTLFCRKLVWQLFLGGSGVGMKEISVTYLFYFHFCFYCLMSVGCWCRAWFSCSWRAVGCSVPPLAEAVKWAAPFLLRGARAAQRALVLPFISVGTKWSSRRDDVIGIAAAGCEGPASHVDHPRITVKVPGSQLHLDLKSFTGEVLQLGRVFGVSLSGSWNDEWL